MQSKTHTSGDHHAHDDGSQIPEPISIPIDAKNREIILKYHPNENAEDVIAAYSFPRNVMQPIDGAFGTWKRPTLIPSAKSSRVVACTGGDSIYYGYKMFHDPMWLVVQDNGKKYECDECGQIFKLLRLLGSKPGDVEKYAEEVAGEEGKRHAEAQEHADH